MCPESVLRNWARLSSSLLRDARLRRACWEPVTEWIQRLLWDHALRWAPGDFSPEEVD